MINKFSSRSIRFISTVMFLLSIFAVQGVFAQQITLASDTVFAVEGTTATVSGTYVFAEPVHEEFYFSASIGTLSYLDPSYSIGSSLPFTWTLPVVTLGGSSTVTLTVVEWSPGQGYTTEKTFQLIVLPATPPNAEPEVRVTPTAEGIGFFWDGQMIPNLSIKFQLGDLDGDGDLDAFIAGLVHPAQIWKNDGTGQFSLFQSVEACSSSVGIALKDLDGDADLDAVLVADELTNDTVGSIVLLNDGSGNFTPGQTLALRENNVGFTDVAIADFNNDGTPDVCVYKFVNRQYNIDSGYLDIFYNNGAAGFTSASTIAGFEGYEVFSYGLAAGDLDGNGYIDLAASLLNGETILLFNSSTGFTVGAQTLTNFPGMAAIETHLGDLDGDSDLDLYVDGLGTPKILWFNDGTGFFTAGSQMICLNGSSASDLGDLDNDGDPDIYAAGLGEACEVWLNDGSGTFTLSDIPTNPVILGVTLRLADLDSDADLDLFTNMSIFAELSLIHLNTAIVTVDEGGMAAATGTATDGNNDPLALSADFGNVTDNQNNTWYWDFASSDDLTQTVRVTADDGQATGVSNFTLVVKNVAPSITNLSALSAVAAGEALTLDVHYSDPGVLDAHTVKVQWGDGTTDNLDGANGLAQFTKTYAAIGAYTITVIVTDDDQGADTATLAIEVINPNQAPVIAVNNASLTVVEGSLAANSGTVSDADGDALTLTASIGTVTNNGNGTWSWSYATTDDLNQTVTVTVSDGKADPVSTSFSLTATNAAPVITGVTISPTTLYTNLPASVATSFTDAGTDAFTVTIAWGDNLSSTIDNATSPAASAHTYTAPGVFTITITVTDDDGSSVTSSQNITVVSQSPVIAANNASVTVVEGALASNNGTMSDPDGDALTLTASIGTAINNGNGTWSWSYATTDDINQTVTVTVSDGNAAPVSTNFFLTATNVAPVIVSVVAPIVPVNISAQPVSVVTTFTDAGADAFTVTVAWGDNTTSTIDNAISPATATHTYAAAGVYPVTVTVTDDNGGTASELHEYIVIYDPNGGFVTGGGWINSPAGAYISDPTLTGKANFGFVSKYHKGATIPTGNTEFNFKAGPLNFKSTVYDWLVITANNTSANYKGSGKINGALAPNGEAYKFKIWAKDLTTDTFRIKIWYEVGEDETVVYDNGTDQAIGGGNVQIHD